MKKLIITLLMMILSFITFSSFSFALFNFVSDSTLNENVCVDPIKQNYEFSNSVSIARDTFTVYFFPQPRYALGASKGSVNYKPAVGQTAATEPDFNGIFTGNLNTNLSNVKGQDILDYQKYANEYATVFSNKASSYGEGPNGRSVTGRYGKADGYFVEGQVESYNYKSFNVEKVIPNSVFSSLHVKSAMNDDRTATFQFCGWTPSQSVAINKGYGGTGDFGLVDSNTSLKNLDRVKFGYTTPLNDSEFAAEKKKGSKAVDGSLIGDGIVYLYPVFSVGKDYKDSGKLDCVEINDSASTTIFLSQFKSPSDQSFGGISYVAKNIHLKKDEVNVKNFSMRLKPYYRDTWLEGVWSGENVKLSTTSVKINNKTTNLPANKPLDQTKLLSHYGDFNIYFYLYNNRNQTSTPPSTQNKNYMPKYLESKNITDIYYFSGEHTWGSNIFNTYRFQLTGWIYIEEVFEYKVLGGNDLTFNYDSPTIDTAYPTVESNKELFVADNVVFTNVKNGKFNYKSKTGFKHTFGNGVFGILPISSYRERGLEKFTLNIDSNSTDTLAKAVPGTDYVMNSSDTQFYNTFNNNLLKIKKDGYYTIKCKVDRANKIITVNAEPVIFKIFTVIFENKSDIKYVNNNVKGFIDLDYSINNAKGTVYINSERVNNKVTGIPSLQYGDTLYTDTTNLVPFAKKVGNTYTKVSFDTILPKNGVIYDIATDLPYGDGNVLLDPKTNKYSLDLKEEYLFSNRVFYINP